MSFHAVILPTLYALETNYSSRQGIVTAPVLFIPLQRQDSNLQALY